MHNRALAVVPPQSLQNIDISVEELAEGITRLPPRPHHAALIDYLNSCWPGVFFQHRYSRSGWYKSGGIRDQKGSLLSQNMESWLEEQLQESGDFEQLFINLKLLQPLVTRFNGVTHVFTAAYGHAPEACWQLEVDELQEVMDRKLLNPDTTDPMDLSDLSDPLFPASLNGQPLGFPFYQFGCLTNVHLALEIAINAPSLKRFFDEWTQSGLSDFHRHWFFLRLNTQHSYGVQEFRLQPCAVKVEVLKLHPWDLSVSASKMADQLRNFDKAAGFFGAWYFCMVSGHMVPSELAERLQNDWQNDYRYITDRQFLLIRNWLYKPYHL